MARGLYCRCGNLRRDSRDNRCRVCFAAYMREYRRTHAAELSAWQKDRRDNVDYRRLDAVGSHARYYRDKGVLIPQPCQCGALDVQMHHPDYGEPLMVQWMCAPCHRKLHANG